MSGLFYHYSLEHSISNSRVSVLFLSLLCFIEIPVFNANSVDPDQMQHSVASDLGLHCLPITLLGVSRLKWVKIATKLWHQQLMPFWIGWKSTYTCLAVKDWGIWHRIISCKQQDKRYYYMSYKYTIFHWLGDASGPVNILWYWLACTRKVTPFTCKPGKYQVLMTSLVVMLMSKCAFCVNGVWCWLLLPQLSREKTKYIIKQLLTIEVLIMTLISPTKYQY